MNKYTKPYGEQTTNLEKFSPVILAEIEELFEKKFSYTKPSNSEWQLPDSSDVFTCNHKEFNTLLALKDSMNEVKNQLSDKKLDAWHQHTSFTNKAGIIIPHVKKSVNAELCTQAWCKFHEILCSFPLLPKEAVQNGELYSVHLCEAPGAFIASLNHYLKSHHIPCDWNWVANTLNPYHEANDTLVMIMDDRLIANTLPWWYFGPDNTGDVMTLKHLTGLQHFISNMTTVHLLLFGSGPPILETLVSPVRLAEPADVAGKQSGPADQGLSPHKRWSKFVKHWCREILRERQKFAPECLTCCLPSRCDVCLMAIVQQLDLDKITLGLSLLASHSSAPTPSNCSCSWLIEAGVFIRGKTYELTEGGVVVVLSSTWNSPQRAAAAFGLGEQESARNSW
ncbi:FtsJ methyltransferase domain-containing protein 1 [Chelonia mydas]|uniref:FtsJ methyltransferase domain-containing protein 1 n=1 Tax=Chelonia mydas TaxID=8469 RepID=M7BZ86_CHEMY|nr:FtsJ methyltransferase domain-containing protein 1 [Chelonia mydas]